MDLEGNTVLVREKKRSRQERTTRRVLLTPALAVALKGWLARHPGGDSLFCHPNEVHRSKKRGRTTGHKSQKGRPTTLRGRLAGVRPRAERPGPEPLMKDEAHDHFKRTLAGSRWDVLRGFHVLRHSFISALASAGVDQRVIDDIVCHPTDEQRKRYRHLYPDVKQQAVLRVFG